MSTTRNTYLRSRRRSPKSWRPVRTFFKRANKKANRQKNFRYHHYA